MPKRKGMLPNQIIPSGWMRTRRRFGSLPSAKAGNQPNHQTSSHALYSSALHSSSHFLAAVSFWCLMRLINKQRNQYTHLDPCRPQAGHNITSAWKKYECVREKSCTPALGCPKIHTHTQGNSSAVKQRHRAGPPLLWLPYFLLEHHQIQPCPSLNSRHRRNIFIFFVAGWETILAYWLDKGAALQTSVLFKDGLGLLSSCQQGTSPESLWSREKRVYENESKLGLNKINRDLIELCELELQSRATY